MNLYDHLPLPEYQGDLQRKKRPRGGGYKFPRTEREKKRFYEDNIRKTEEISKSFRDIRKQYEGKLKPHLIFRLKVNQSVHPDSFIKQLHSLGGLTVLSIAEDRKGYWIVFSDDEEFTVFKDKLAQYSGVKKGHKYEYFNAIDELADIPKNEKIGKSLKEQPLKPEEIAYLSVELWRMEDRQLRKFTEDLQEVYSESSTFRITDRLITNSFALYRMKMSGEILENLLGLKEVARIDRPHMPVFRPYEHKQIDISDFKISPPDDDASGILILDTGIVSNHPMLEKAVGAEENFQDCEKGVHDLVGHGTAVAGLACYGDIEQCIADRSFTASNWIFSAKVMHGEQDFQGNLMAAYDPTRLFENQVNDAIRAFLDNPDYRVKVVNMSFGNKFEILKDDNNRQFPLAALLDELAYEYSDVVFVISIGNQDPLAYKDVSDILDNYPDYLVEDSDFKIINPASSALSLTVGSTAPPIRYFDAGFRGPKEHIWVPIAQENEPSPFTRSGNGINGMIKPELTHYGGNLIVKNSFGRTLTNIGGKLTVLSNNPVRELFAFDYGTSFAAPQVAHLAGLIVNKYPHESANFIKNVLLQSADHLPLPAFKGAKNDRLKSLRKVQGYGLPDYRRAAYSFENRVVLLDEGVIGLDEVKVFSVNVPTAFFEQPGDRMISVVLTFNPPTRATRGDSYLGNRMEFKLFHTVDPEEVVEKYAENDLSVVDGITPLELRQFEFEMLPGVNTRKAGCHQKGYWKRVRMTQQLPRPPLSLVLINSKKWLTEGHRQSYCISLLMEHSQDVRLYEFVRNEVRPRVQIRG